MESNLGKELYFVIESATNHSASWENNIKIHVMLSHPTPPISIESLCKKSEKTKTKIAMKIMTYH